MTVPAGSRYYCYDTAGLGGAVSPHRWEQTAGPGQQAKPIPSSFFLDGKELDS